MRLGVYAQAASAGEIRDLIKTVWGLENAARVKTLLPNG